MKYVSFSMFVVSCLFCLLVFNVTFNNISLTCISWQSVLLGEEIGGPGENHQPVASHCVNEGLRED